MPQPAAHGARALAIHAPQIQRSPDPWYQMIAPDYDAYVEAEQEYAALLAEEGITPDPNATFYYTNLNSTLRTNTVLGFSEWPCTAPGS